MNAARTAVWGSLPLIAWTHAGYPRSAANLRRYAPRRDEDFLLGVALALAAHDGAYNRHEATLESLA